MIVVGAGLAGSECALQLADRGVQVKLYEQRPVSESPAHHTENFAELVCSNSLKSLKPESAAGLLKIELEIMGSRLLQYAVEAQVPAGGALAVDRNVFSGLVTKAVNDHPNIEVIHERVDSLPEGDIPCVIAAGPLCGDRLFEAITQKVGADASSFYDAAAPIVDATTIDRDIIFSQSRWEDEGAGDYLNCPMNKEQYEAFWKELVEAKRVVSKEFEQTDLFCACQPAEEVARTGMDSLRYGAMKPVGLKDPRTGHRPWAAVQLRAENSYQTAYNLVGFQTNLTWPEQKRIFRMIPGLENAEFFRYGVMHRNSFVDSPRVLDRTFKIPETNIRLAGQITGTEGYTEAIASGLLAALNTYAELEGMDTVELPVTGSFGSLVDYATDPQTKPYQPMHVNFGIFRPLEDMSVRKQARYKLYSERAQKDLENYVAERSDLFNQ